MTLEAVRPFKSSIDGHVDLQKGIATNVLYAAGSSHTAPKGGECNAWITFFNHHDLGAIGLTGHVTADLFAPPGPEPKLATNGSVQLGCCGLLTWQVNGDNVALRVDAAVEKGMNPGWLGIGFSPAGTMAAGDYIIGYPGCVRALSSTKEGRAPGSRGDPEPFNLTDTSFSISGHNMTLEATRPLRTFVPGHAMLGADFVNVLYAAGSGLTVPLSCRSKFSSLNIHDIGYLTGTVRAGIYSGTPPSPTPPTPPPPGDKWKCVVCMHVYDPMQDAAAGCAKASPPCKAPVGTAFLDLPDSWVCPVCLSPKSAFKRTVDSEIGEEQWVHEHGLVV